MNKKYNGKIRTTLKRSGIDYYIDNTNLEYTTKNSTKIVIAIQWILFILISLFIILSCGLVDNIPNLF